MLVRVSPPKLVKIDELEPDRSLTLIPIEESSITTQPPVVMGDPLAVRIFVIACGCLGAIGLVILGMLLARPPAPVPQVQQQQPQPSIVIVPAPAQNQSGSKCLAFCSQ
ncbi:hypothetical protein NIES2135_53830 [Leptolyngbya boryana NIES-2135]|jgi:hypothetical protein|uniref:Uncharacterized protein n=1 Tax=Leptolyngbya boryana NIES-2135 TaxID=1973484 RepID=A0A1Z4JP76_LEPBY|nr:MULTISPECIES: hypothetical protein [Leptolyngbya]BAY58510.1 hypothetical protein NIES2135_53830 [Leptolyngbya boryana NIES-2135]MBD2370984.1 hypothetical protein [Leptolyngbya sp. FACHB-161]MBD2377498.1 hypothetical protein [Leptolyngbya sp. FACHB-238]MBD2401907.1 hypothetical protein [Leptolyngbya sp. FACHB-239]MBD2408424.1 hypothetical protein [Leptolyngbya sp. FACHB-402]